MLTAIVVLGLFAGTALASPTNTALPTISPATPKVASQASATTGTWNSTSPAHWFEDSTQLQEGKLVSVSATGGSITYAATLVGASGWLTCNSNVSGASIENPSGGGAGLGSAEIEYSGCVAGGDWSKCTVVPGPAMGLKMELGTLEGKAKIVLSPTGAYLGTFTLTGSGCVPGGSIKPVGVINGLYSNGSSQIEFNPETTSTGLRLGSKVGPKATATGTIGLQVGGKAVKADSLSYGYQWKRCHSGCSTIAGATGSTYVPVAADQGKALKVAVTATDSTGGTTVESAQTKAVTASLSWYVSQGGGAWSRPASTSFTASEVAPTTITYNYSGVYHEITCSGGSGSGTLTNTSTQANVEGFKLTLTGCVLTKPISCNIEGEKLVFSTLKASSPAESTSELKHELKFVPESGGTLVEFAYTGCALAGKRSFTGYFPAQFVNEGSRLTTTSSEVLASGGMRLQGITGPPVGMTSASTVLSEGAKPVKLDVEP